MSETDAERLTRLETQMEQVFEFQSDHKTITKEMNDKLDNLLALRHKGQGAFWLASALFGTSIIGLVSTVWGYFTHG